MQGFSKRERIIIGAVYRDCQRIALERVVEQKRGEPRMSGKEMAEHLAELFVGRKDQILKYECDLARYRRRRWS